MLSCFLKKDHQLKAFIKNASIASLRLVLVWSFIISFFVSLLFLTQFGLNMRDSSYDLLLNIKAYLAPIQSKPEDSPVVIVAIDNYTLSSSAMAVPELFQHRYYTTVVKSLNQAGAKAVALVRVLPRSKDDYSAPEDVRKWLDMVSDMDMPVLSGLIWRPNQVVLPDVDYLAAMRAASFGFINMPGDGDSVVRRVPLRWPGCDEAFGCYSLSWLAASTLLPGLKMPGEEILLDFDPRPDIFPVYSFLDVYKQGSAYAPDVEMSPERLEYFKQFKDKLVLIGDINYLSEGSWSTPFADRSESGATLVEITAQAVNSLLTKRYFYSMGPLGTFLFLFALAALSMAHLAFSHRQGPYLMPWFPLFLIPAYLAASVLAFIYHFYLPVLPGFMVLLLSRIFLQAVKAMERRETIRTSLTALGLYINPTLAEEIMAHPELLSRSVERRVMTVFFSDLVGFTTLAECTSPEELVVSLNRYFECMEPIISKHGGILDKYDGDSLMAFWGAPLMPRFDHAASGCLAALDQQEALQRLNLQFIAEGRQPFVTLMGLTTESMVAGNIGTQNRLNYTVMGDAVNLASRLVPVNKMYRTKIIISELTAMEAARLVELRTLDKITVPGRRKSLTIFEAMAHKGRLSNSQRQGRDVFEKALKLYFDREFEKAMRLFGEVMAFMPGDGPSELMYTRCRSYIADPPDDDWHGVTALHVKR